MNAQNFEKMCHLFENAVNQNDTEALKQLAVKSAILRERGAKSASVIREIRNQNAN